MRYIYCHPLFDERKCAHRFSYRLAKAFERKALKLERFDYRGTGEAAGRFSDITMASLQNDLKEKTGLGQVVYDRIKELRQHGYIKIEEPGAGNIAAKYCRNPYPTGVVGLELPDLKNSDCSNLSGKADANAEVLI